MLYYIFATAISLTVILTSYFAPQALSVFGGDIAKNFANIGMILLWITLFVKPVFMIFMKYSELKTITFSGLWAYLKTIKGRSLKGLGKMLVSIIYFIAGLGMKRRRLLGITVFLLLFAHSGINVVHRLNDGFGLASQLNAFRILAGYISLVALLMGYITSNNFSIRIFKRHWKSIQNLAYVALLFGILHVAFLNLGDYGGYIVVLVIYILFKLVEKKKIMKNI